MEYSRKLYHSINQLYNQIKKKCLPEGGQPQTGIEEKSADIFSPLKYVDI